MSQMSQAVDRHRRRFLGAAAMTLAAAPFGLFGSPSRLPIEGDLPALHGATSWLNSEPLTKGGLRGKVVLVDFWTYSCINWRRSLPYVRAWAARYREHGLVVIGAHSPEFAFERDLDNVRQAAQMAMIDYPIAIDNDFAIWRAFGNEFWPALYFIDEKGHIRHHKFGEGDYDQSEAVIQLLLEEAGVRGFGPGLASVNASNSELAADWPDLKSGENYVGYERTENFTSPGGAVMDKIHSYVSPAELKLNHWGLAGDWTTAKHEIRSNSAHSRITYQFHARDLHLVMGPETRGVPVQFRVLIDGHMPGSARGTDVDEQGNGTVVESRMYHLIRQEKPIVDRRFEIEFLDRGAEAYSFTFG
jgi:thiol-disulfide isomerase/thioredoxin